MSLPNLAGIATQNLVDKIGANGFQASYINWARTLDLLRTHAPDWHPELVLTPQGEVLHRAPVGGFLMIRFVNVRSGYQTPPVPQAVMDNRNAALPWEKITARELTDTHVRGICKAAAVTFGLAYELWAKMPLESGYAEPSGKAEPSVVVTPTDGAWEALDSDTQIGLEKMMLAVGDFMAAGDHQGAWDYILAQKLGADEKTALWTKFDSKTRTILTKVAKATKETAP